MLITNCFKRTMVKTFFVSTNLQNVQTSWGDIAKMKRSENKLKETNINTKNWRPNNLHKLDIAGCIFKV